MTIPVRVGWGSQEVLSSGTLVVTDPNHEPYFDVADLRFVLAFRKTSGGPNLRSEPISPNAIKIILENFESPLPITWHSDGIGTVSKRPISFAIAVQTITDKDTIRLIAYTFTAGAAA